LVFKGNVLFIHKAPEPGDINWENCGITDSGKNRFISNALNFFLIALVFAILTGLKYGFVIIFIKIIVRLKQI
jgi:membrane protein insertase Oxa1/YidC/SpoIIIJ